MTKLKLFVWEDVLKDWTPGIMFALAPDVETARKLLLEKDNIIPKNDLYQTPDVYEEPFAGLAWGGG